MRSLRHAFLPAAIAVIAVASAAAQPAAPASPSTTATSTADTPYIGFRAELADGGIRVSQVLPDSPASKAGLRVGDVVSHLGGAKVRTLADIGQALAERRPGDVVVLRVARAGKPVTIEVRLGRRSELGATAPTGPATGSAPAPAATKATAASETPAGPPYIGVEVSQGRRGLLVEAVRDGSPAAAAELAVGDVLHRFGESQITGMDDLVAALGRKKVGDRVALAVERSGTDISLSLTLGTRGGAAPSAAAEAAADAIETAATRDQKPSRPRRGERTERSNADESSGAAAAAPVDDGIGVAFSDAGTRVKIASVRVGGPAERAGLRAGDVVTHVAGDSVSEPAAFLAAIEAAERTVVGRVVVRVDRNGTRLDLPLDVARPGGGGSTRNAGSRGVGGVVSALGAVGKTGVVLLEVADGGTASRFGLRSGDVITSVDGRAVRSAEELRRVLESTRAQTLGLVRAGRESELRLRGGAAPTATDPERPWLGVELAPTSRGLEVSAVRPGSPAAHGGLRVGDVLAEFAGEPVRASEALSAALSRKRPGDRVTLRVERGETPVDLKIVLGRRDG